MTVWKQRVQRLREQFMQCVFPPCCPFCSTPTGRALHEPCRECEDGLRLRSVEDRAWLLLEAAPQIPVFCAFEYLPPVPQAIRMFKFHQGLSRVPGLVRATLPPLWELLSRLQRGWIPGSDPLGYFHWLPVDQEFPAGQFPLWPMDAHGRRLFIQGIVPMPLHPKRLRQRGYNQAEVLAQALGGILNLPVLSDGLIRTRYTERQTELRSDQERMQNVRGAFQCTESFVQAWQSRAVLLVDDVLTTGSTWLEAARTLQEVGVHPMGWILASNHAGHLSLRP